MAYLSQNTIALSRLSQVSLIDITSLLVLSIFVLILLGIQFKTLASAFSTHLTTIEWLGLTAINSMLNLAIPAKAGLLVRGMYLKKVHHFPFTEYSKLLVTSHLAMMGLISALGLILLGFIVIEFKLKFGLILFFFSILLSLITLTYLTPIIITRAKPSWLKSTINLFNIWPTIAHTQKSLWITFGFILILLNFLWAAKLYLCFLILGSTPEFTSILLIQCVVSLSFVVSVTPGNLGIKEAVTAFGATLLGLPAEIALLASLLDRATSMLVIITFGLISTQLLSRDLTPSKI